MQTINNIMGNLIGSQIKAELTSSSTRIDYEFNSYFIYSGSKSWIVSKHMFTNEVTVRENGKDYKLGHMEGLELYEKLENAHWRKRRGA